ncbi:MAG: hypothetical protein BJ554DRAFT_2516, partial [Olpidium bornovanus]
PSSLHLLPTPEPKQKNKKKKPTDPKSADPSHAARRPRSPRPRLFCLLGRAPVPLGRRPEGCARRVPDQGRAGNRDAGGREKGLRTLRLPAGGAEVRRQQKRRRLREVQHLRVRPPHAPRRALVRGQRGTRRRRPQRPEAGGQPFRARALHVAGPLCLQLGWQKKVGRQGVCRVRRPGVKDLRAEVV